ncbi:MAG: filamentous hemagglutinin N-terminal domain-containing protein [Sphingobacteriia bacterium]|nr:filamentous hemagglutinin N-terminal domain-containing protein [Sphingobacteriia bacterium]
MVADEIPAPLPNALPTGADIVQGNATLNYSDNRLDINQNTPSLTTNWNSFNIGESATVTFHQPSTDAIAINKVIGSDMSKIFGNLEANGKVYLINPNGVIFGENASVNVGSIVASTLDMLEKDSFKGKDGKIINYGSINAKEIVALLGKEVINEGFIVAKMGVALASGSKIKLDFDGKGLINVVVDEPILNGLIENKKVIVVDGGKIIMRASTKGELFDAAIKNSGTIQANRVMKKNGKIYIDSEDGNFKNEGTIEANEGHIEITSNRLFNSGEINTNGTKGGDIKVNANTIIQQGNISADGTEDDGGKIDIDYEYKYIESSYGQIRARGKNKGGKVKIKGNENSHYFTSGEIDASGEKEGGTIAVTAEALKLFGADIKAEGKNKGGDIKIGGDFKGHGAISQAKETIVNNSTNISAKATENGSGGNIVVWSDEKTEFTGTINANAGINGGNGGKVEVSSKNKFYYGGEVTASAPNGEKGEVILDPKNITISNTGGGFPYYELIDPSPSGGNAFGTNVKILGNGNVVVGVPNDDATASNAGAVHLFHGTTGSLISTFTGARAGDAVGSNLYTLTGNNNFVTQSSTVGDGINTSVGAVTWIDGTLGRTGSVSAANSLMGSTTNDQIGNAGIETGVVALTNGNYVVVSPNWDNGATSDAGAVTWADGTTGRIGLVSTANSLYGTTASDRIGFSGVTALTNGHYVVGSQNWNNGGGVAFAGAATWGNGGTGITGAVSTLNSLYGSTTGDSVGYKTYALTNGNYVVASPFWANGGTSLAGAVTWGNGATGTTGAVSTLNSLYGTTASDRIGGNGITALTNGHYVVVSSFWDNGGTADVGAVTWGDGATAGARLTGAVSTTNSLYGTTSNDRVGQTGITALTNGNYVVRSADWSGGGISLGAATWINGSNGRTVNGNTGEAIDNTNSLVGQVNYDQVGVDGVYALTNGNYIVASSIWDAGSGISNRGAVTWGDGTTGIFGNITALNSLLGSTNGDQLGQSITPLTNGNYVILSRTWRNGGVNSFGAVTWANGSAAITGSVDTTNSLYGTTHNDLSNSSVVALNNGNYVVIAPNWDNGATSEAGAVIWGDGATAGTRLTGAISTANSIYGSTANDQVGSNGIVALANNNYLINSPLWNNGAIADAGAVTWADGSSGSTGAVSSLNSIIGTSASAGSSLGSLDNNTVSSFLARFPNDGTGKVYIGFKDPTFLTFNRGRVGNFNIHPSFLTNILNAGTAVTLQANNDITINSPLTANNGGGNGGNLTLQAGRSVLINANVTSDNGNITIIGNETTADGVIDAQRDAGAATITMATATTLDAGAGNISITLKDGAGKTNTTSGDITLSSLNAAHVLVQNDGPTNGSNILKSAGTPTITATSAAFDISNATNIIGSVGTSGSHISTNISNLEASTQGGNVYINNGSTDLTIGGATLGGLTGINTNGGDLFITSGLFNNTEIISVNDLTINSDDDINDSAVITTTGNASFTTTGANKNITLDQVSSYNGAVSLNTSDGNASIINLTTNLDLGNSTVNGDLTISTVGNITDSGNINVIGTSSFTTTGIGTDITLDNASSYTGSVSLNTNDGNATLTNVTSDLDLGSSTVNGDLIVSTIGNISDSGSLNVSGNSSFATTGTNKRILLDDVASNYGGSVTLTNRSNTVVYSSVTPGTTFDITAPLEPSEPETPAVNTLFNSFISFIMKLEDTLFSSNSEENLYKSDKKDLLKTSNTIQKKIDNN